jgi:predicted RNA binding protein YcfA (HicA-like mRNA interferase family)
MSNLPSLHGQKLIKVLRKFGFEVIRIKGSHHFLRHSDGRSTVIPAHGKETIGIGLFHKILKDCEISIEDFLKDR